MTFTEQEGRTIVIARSMDRCEVCGRPGDSVHHRIKKGQGGAWSPSNLLRVCGDGTRGCHGWIEAHPLYAGALGLGVPSYTADPATVPVWCRPTMWRRAWWQFLPDGCLKWRDPEELALGTGAEEAIAAVGATRYSWER